MDKICEYCKVLRPVVYCKADSANLCLPCDVKIHSANALSNRHSRTLLCELCRCHWAYIKCSDHQMFMCRNCDRSQHNVLSQHRRNVISSYSGCPSAKDLAQLWGFDLDVLDGSTQPDQYFSTSGVSASTGAVKCDTLVQSCSQGGRSLSVSEMDSVTPEGSASYEMGSTSKYTKELYKGNQEKQTCFILQQILDLKRLQITDSSNSSSFRHPQEQTDICLAENDSTWKLGQHLQYSFHPDSDFQQVGSPDADLHADSFPSPFSQLDHLTISSSGESPMQVDSIWQSKDPEQSGQLWSQNMQDLGVCEEAGCLEELSMPDIDLSFRNFEELFGDCEHEPTRVLLNDKSTTSVSMEKKLSFDKAE